MPSTGAVVFGRAIAASFAFSACCAAQGGFLGPSLGTVEFRWRERSTAGYNGSYAIGPETAPGVDVVPTPDPSAASVTAQDASVVLVLEAKVTQAAGLTGSPIRGLFNAQFNISTNQESGGAFSRQVVSDGLSLNPRANARVNTTNLGFNPATLPSNPTGTQRTLVAPYRYFANQPNLNGPALGHFQSGANTIYKMLPVLSTDNLNPGNEEATHPGRYDLAGLDNWVPLCIVIYTITDVATARDIVFTVGPSDDLAGAGYDFGTWRGQPNPANDNTDRWKLLPGFTTPPTFTVHVVPGSGAAGVMGVGALLAMARRRR